MAFKVPNFNPACQVPRGAGRRYKDLTGLVLGQEPAKAVSGMGMVSAGLSKT